MFRHEFSKYSSAVALIAGARAIEYEHLIDARIERFFQKSGVSPRKIEFSNAISDFDFKDVHISYLYNVVFSGSRCKDGIVNAEIKYILTLDIESCDFYCSDSSLRYGCILMGEHPILYFFYVDVKDFFRFVRGAE